MVFRKICCKKNLLKEKTHSSLTAKFHFLLLRMLPLFFIIATLTISFLFIAYGKTATLSPPDATIYTKSPTFDGICGVYAFAEMRNNIYDHHSLMLYVKNTSGKNILSIKFYLIPYDIYGEEVTGWLTTYRYLHTDTPIAAGETVILHYEPFIKPMKLYIYSVSFADGTEWGDKYALKSTILSRGVPVEIFELG